MQQYHNENELVVSNKRKQAIFENNPISIDETEPESKFKKIDGSTPVLLVVESQAPVQVILAQKQELRQPQQLQTYEIVTVVKTLRSCLLHKKFTTLI